MPLGPPLPPHTHLMERNGMELKGLDKGLNRMQIYFQEILPPLKGKQTSMSSWNVTPVTFGIRLLSGSAELSFRCEIQFMFKANNKNKVKRVQHG